MYLFKFTTQTCKRDNLSDFDNGVGFKCTVRKAKVLVPWNKATPEEYGEPTNWKRNNPKVPESLTSDEEDMDEFVFHDA